MVTSIKQDEFQKTALRLPRDLHARLHEAAATSGRSYNAEIVNRLQASFQGVAQVIASPPSLASVGVPTSIQETDAGVQWMKRVAERLDETEVKQNLILAYSRVSNASSELWKAEAELRAAESASDRRAVAMLTEKVEAMRLRASDAQVEHAVAEARMDHFKAQAWSDEVHTVGTPPRKPVAKKAMK